jgi:hypothetical protein
LPVLEKYIFTLLNGAIDFVRPQGYLFGWASATFLGKKILLKLVLRFTQVCPCIGLRTSVPLHEKKSFLSFF